jgi:hypothetical protein
MEHHGEQYSPAPGSVKEGRSQHGKPAAEPLTGAQRPLEVAVASETQRIDEEGSRYE